MPDSVCGLVLVQLLRFVAVFRVGTRLEKTVDLTRYVLDCQLAG